MRDDVFYIFIKEIMTENVALFLFVLKAEIMIVLLVECGFIFSVWLVYKSYKKITNATEIGISRLSIRSSNHCPTRLHKRMILLPKYVYIIIFKSTVL